MNENPSLKIQREEEFDIKKVISKFLDQWKLYAICAVILIILGFIFLKAVTPMYTANAQVLIQDDDSKSDPSSFLSSTALSGFSDLLGVQSNVSNELGILNTPDLVYKVVHKMNLNVSYYVNGILRPTELYSKSPFTVTFIPKSDSTLLTTYSFNSKNLNSNKNFELKISNDDIDQTVKGNFEDTIRVATGKLFIHKTGIPFDESSSYYFTTMNKDQEVAVIQSNLSIAIPSSDATILSLSYNSNVPKKAEDVLNQLIQEYTFRNLNEKNKISDSTIAFIDGRIEIVGAELNSIEANIQGFKQNNHIADITEQSTKLIDNTSQYIQQLNQVEVQLNVIQSTLDYIRNENGNDRPVPSTLNNDPTFLSLVQKYNSLLVEKDGLKLASTEANPAIQNINAQISNLRGDIIKSLVSQKKALDISKSKIVAQNSLLSNMIENVPAQERQYVDLTREQSVKQALYLYLLQKKEETAITKASNIASASTIQEPKTSYLPYFPNKILVFATVLLLILIIPTGIILLKQLLNNRILSREDITSKTNTSIMAEIGHNEKVGLISLKDQGRSAIAEQFRVFRTNMDFATRQEKCPVILITSSMSAEGKSFVTGNLGQIYAYSGKKVLLMEMDLRKPKLSGMFGMSNDNGFTNYMIGKQPLENFIKPVKGNENLYLMSSGPVPPNPSEILLSAQVETMFEELKNQFDIIIIDTAPIGAVTDALILANHSNVNLYIMRQRYTYKNSLDIITDLRESERINNLYIVVNDVKKG
ncbi:MAG: polysaccharide biosynthesis tyrosine autokinase, partial [Bacteroidetes bacterium]|nr:polysaccharide biosynthesis tyrosine autokinase [Bacteroidota bacterium]